MKASLLNLLSSILNLVSGDKVAVVGCWGKTSLIKCLAHENGNKAVVSPTTKMYPIEGVNCVGIPEPDGKLGPIPLNELAALPCDITLMEADGSNSLPFKGYRDYEPVIPLFTTKTIAVINMLAFGIPATEDNVHRLPEFLLQTGLKEGDIICPDAAASMLKVMLRNRKGQTVLLINGCTGKVSDIPVFDDIDIVIAGCTYNKTWRKL